MRRGLMDLTLAIFMLAININLASAYDLSEYFPLGETDTWEYSVTENESIYEESCKVGPKEMIQGVETYRILYQDNIKDAPESNFENISLDPTGIRIYRTKDDTDVINYSQPIPLFLDTNIGESKKFSAVITIQDYNTQAIKEKRMLSGQVELNAVSDVEVAAGKFNNCLKFSITSEDKDTDGDYYKEDCTVWLAPSVGKVKEFCIDTEYDVETQKEDTSMKILELVSAVVDGKKIGSQ